MNRFHFGLICLFSAVSVGAFASDELVQTPGGLRPRSMVREINPFETVRGRDDSLSAPDSPERVSSRVVDSGWIVSSFWSVPENNKVHEFHTQWTVPQEPPKKGSQLLYLFNSLMPSDETAILQPVLQWGLSPAGGGPYWAVASWYVKASGEAYHTPLVKVSPGEVLHGVMTFAGQGAKGFAYQSEFQGIPGTKFSIQDIGELTMATETLEVYSVDDCSEYPVGMTAFLGIGMTLESLVPEFQWYSSNWPHACRTNLQIVSQSITNGEVDLYY